MKDITILSIPSGGIQRTLYHEGVKYVWISHDGLFLASCQFIGREARLWSITQGTLLATFETGWRRMMVFSRTNRLYVAGAGGGRVYDVSADPNSTIKSFPLPSIGYSAKSGSHKDLFWRATRSADHTPKSLLPAPDESQILIRRQNDIQVWSLRQLTDARDAPRDDIMGIDLSDDASLLAHSTETEIEIWDARIGQRLRVIQSRS